MIEIRRSGERGHADHGWLKTLHSFSFADYYDPRHMGFGALRVINEDRVAPGSGFGTHGHRDMEIITYVLEGALAHRDSLGNGSVIRPGDVQRMSAGTGVQHSEYNHEQQGVTHFLQIWLEPAQRGIAPGYEQRHFEASRKRGRLQPIAAPDGREDALTIHQDAIVYAALLDAAERVEGEIADGRRAYVHLVRGRLRVNGEPLEAGDAAKLTGESRFVLDGAEDAEALVFDLA
ncbi:MAG: pirin family protein [Burkholderiaceae bacterium]|jgi:redox-sensitive bicupin YhaK (pirin superfamily)|nr:pirin family protein [Burkholderiaceae bacterium]